ncbi:MAG: 2-oxoglutarate dehydrogenase E1 component [Verrucomicrobiota bacterium]|nr:2-oxoglutarate dehydrogenase E1 component [Verrucomicrobiota bacterium]
MKNLSFATRWNADVLEENYQQWLQGTTPMDPAWAAFFEGFELARSGTQVTGQGINGDGAALPSHATKAEVLEFAKKQARFTGAIYAYRSIGHTQADINPLYQHQPENPRLSLERLGFTEADLDTEFDSGNFQGAAIITLRDMLEKLRKTYCGTIGVEYLHIQDTAQRRWLQSRMEPIANQPTFTREKKHRILDKIVQAELFEKFLHTRFVGQKRFGLEGGETLIAAMDALTETGPEHGLEEIVIGMAHRGRLNILANTIGKSYDYIFHEFSENYIPDLIHGDGDVKYHLGYDAVRRTATGKSIVLQLAANPSHLEAVNPVVLGRVRARQRILGDFERKKVLPVLIHGDAAFAGQGIVAEVLNMSQLKGYTTGGTIHLVINNQIGFTTDPTEARSSRYCSDVAKMIEAPIFHVNGDDPEAMVFCTELALEYRQAFGRDVVIDMYCYRRHGHNEVDEPGFTQPILYRLIKDHPLVSTLYAERLKKEGSLTDAEFSTIQDKHTKILEDSYAREKQSQIKEPSTPQKIFRGSTAVFQPPYSFRPVETGVALDALSKVAKCISSVPSGFHLNPKIARVLDERWKNFQAGKGLDWAAAEQLAWGTLMLEGTPVRLSGQDCVRGTFSHRHAMVYDMETRETYFPLMNLPDKRAIMCVHNSLLSEAAVLGFDYGYSLDYPQMLCMWEAQFGDFANGAQVLIDQFLSSSESKWQRISGLVMLLPHGYEGQGPEHSSARLERYLQLCAEDNMQVCNFSTPAQLFHALRRQMKRDFRKPMIVMSPKSLLRHKDCVSTVEEFTKGQFHPILDDVAPPEKPQRVVLCSGKIYYDLAEGRRTRELKDVAILRVEQLYPFDKNTLGRLLDKYSGHDKIIWCQEEPKNMGAYSYIAPILEEAAGKKAVYVGRKPSASPAVGSLNVHKIEQENIVEAALRG